MRTVDDTPRLAGVDLNLLVALDALLAEGSVTRAARRVGLTQPSMSHALARLRDLFGDPLLARSGRAMVLTPRAEALREPLRASLGELARLLSDEGPFDPRTSRRSFVLVCPDLLAAFIPDLLRAMSAQAPTVSLEVRGPGALVASDLASGSSDVSLGPTRDAAPGLTVRPLGEVRWVVLVRRGHPLAGKKLTAKRWAAHPHVQVRTGAGGPSVVEQALGALGVTRRIGLWVPTFLLAPEVVSRTDYLFTAPRELVAPLVTRLKLTMLEPPVRIAPVPVAAFWHGRVEADPGHRWFRELVVGEIERTLKRA